MQITRRLHFKLISISPSSLSFTSIPPLPFLSLSLWLDNWNWAIFNAAKASRHSAAFPDHERENKEIVGGERCRDYCSESWSCGAQQPKVPAVQSQQALHLRLLFTDSTWGFFFRTARSAHFCALDSSNVTLFCHFLSSCVPSLLLLILPAKCWLRILFHLSAFPSATIPTGMLSKSCWSRCVSVQTSCSVCPSVHLFLCPSSSSHSLTSFFPCWASLLLCLGKSLSFFRPNNSKSNQWSMLPWDGKGSISKTKSESSLRGQTSELCSLSPDPHFV